MTLTAFLIGLLVGCILTFIGCVFLGFLKQEDKLG